MVFVEFLHPGCYNQMWMINSKLEATKCGALEGIYWSIIICFVILIIAIRTILNHKKIDIEIETIKSFAFTGAFIATVLTIIFFAIGYTTKWKNQHQAIQVYKKQGLTDYQIFSLLEMESGRNVNPYMSAITSTAGLMFLQQKQPNEKSQNNPNNENNTQNQFTKQNVTNISM